MRSVDERAAQTPVRNQGRRKTCSVFAVTAAHEWMCGDAPDLSVEFALWRAKQRDKNAGEATWPRVVLEAIHEDGQVLDEMWPYGNPAYPAKPPVPARRAPRRMAGAWRVLGPPNPDVIRETLIGGEAVVLEVRFVVDAWQAAAGEGIVDAAASAPTFGGHAILAVGVEGDADGVTRIVIKNSWGDRWGNGGYGYLTESYLASFGRIAYALAPSPAA